MDILDLFPPDPPERPQKLPLVEDGGWGERIKESDRRYYEMEYIVVGPVSRILARGEIRAADNWRIFWCQNFITKTVIQRKGGNP